MNDEKESDIIDVDYQDLDSREYFTIEETAEKLKLEIGQIIYWCNKFDDILKINSIGQFKIFSKEDFRNLITIKELNLDRKMSIREIREYLNSNSKAIVIKKEKELDSFIFNFFSNIVNNQNKKIDQLLENQSKTFKLFSQLYNEMCIDGLEKEKLLNKILDEQHLQKEHSEKLANNITKDIEQKLETKVSELFQKSISEIKAQFDPKELEYQQTRLTEIDYLKTRMLEQKEKYETELEEYRSKKWWNIFIKKK